MAGTRPTVPALEAIIGQEFPVLDRGFVRLVDYMGDDAAVVQAARVSYGSGTKSLRQDRALIGYLMRHGHSSPFEMCELKLHIKLPIFVARQWVRHRTASINEVSARYSVVEDEHYLPQALARQSLSSRQASGEPLEAALDTSLREAMGESSRLCYELYRKLLDKGVARESARCVLPVSFYTQWYWKTDLHNLLHFLELRLGPEAQPEIRQYAVQLSEVVKLWVPTTWEAFVAYRYHP